MNEKAPRHILSLSGGKDSAALAVYMRDRRPDMEYIFHDSGKELPETYEFLARLESMLDKPITRTSPPGSFDHWLTVCASEQAQTFGEPYWTRLPQIRGIELCPKHRAPFVKSSIPRHNPKCYQSLSAEWTTIFTPSQPVPSPNSLIDLAVASQELLEFDAPWSSTDLDHAWEHILERLEIARHGHGNTKKLAVGLLDKYGAKYLTSAGCSAIYTGNDSWLARFLRRPSTEPDPLRHLLILRLFDVTLSTLVNARKKSLAASLRDFGDINCQNPVCPAYKSRTYCHVSPFRHPYTRKKTVAITCVCCGSVVTKTLPSRPSAVNRDHVLHRGARWDELLRKSWMNPSLSIRKIAQTLGCESMTVKRHASRLCLPFLRKGPRPAVVVPASRRLKLPLKKNEVRQRRDSWIAALKESGRVKHARKLAGSAYAWLYRHDREWLRETSTHGEQPDHPPDTPAEWKERERLFISRLNPAVAKIINQVPHRKASLTAILHEIGATKHRQHLRFMPSLLNRLAIITGSNIL